MLVIVSGGTGVIGSTLVTRLSQEGHDVIVLSRNPADSKMDSGVRVVEWDARTADSWGHWMDGADAVINLAGQPISTGIIPTPWNSDYKRKIEQSRRQAGEALTAAIAMAKDKPRFLFQMSGVDYYPYGNKLMSEDDPPGTHYMAKLVSESWEPSTAAVEPMGVRRAVGRTGPLLNTENGPLPSSLLQFKLFAGGRLGSGKQWLPWIHIEDAVRAIQFLMETELAAGAINIVTPNPVTNAQYTSALGKVTGRPTAIPVPEFVMRTALGEVSDLVLKGRPVSSAKLQGLGFEFKFPEIEPALRDLIV